MRSRLMLAFAGAALLMTAVSASAAPARSGSAKVVIGWASPVASQPATQALLYGMEKAASKLGWTVKTLDANLSSNTQVTDLTTFINEKVAGIITWTLDPGAANGVYKQAHDAGIKLVGIDSLSSYFNNEIQPQQFVGCSLADNAAQYIASRIPKAKVLVIGGPPVPSLVAYTNCFIKGAKAKGLDVLEEQNNVNDTAATSEPIVDTMLTKYPDAQAIWAYNDTSALGAGASVLSHGLKVWTGPSHPGVIIIGSSGTQEAITGIEKGEMTATYDQNGPLLGALAIEALAIDLGVHKGTVPHQVIVKTTLYDSSNAAMWVPPAKRNVTLNYMFP